MSHNKNWFIKTYLIKFNFNTLNYKIVLRGIYKTVQNQPKDHLHLLVEGPLAVQNGALDSINPLFLLVR